MVTQDVTKFFQELLSTSVKPEDSVTHGYSGCYEILSRTSLHFCEARRFNEAPYIVHPDVSDARLSPCSSSSPFKLLLCFPSG
jgi:hypothetical protein